ncbi:MAG: hypothetical protein IPK68_15250 [Bdellovibrionales bacterium]|nr:hypothetical protein [Bdellovibrionales bacterium]
MKTKRGNARKWRIVSVFSDLLLLRLHLLVVFALPLLAHAQGASDPGCESTYQKMTTACLATKSAQESATSVITTMDSSSTAINPNAIIQQGASRLVRRQAPPSDQLANPREVCGNFVRAN